MTIALADANAGTEELAVMAEITAALVKELREKTGVGMMDCKKALGETSGNLEAAVDWLRKNGMAAAAKRPGVLPRKVSSVSRSLKIRPRW